MEISKLIRDPSVVTKAFMVGDDGIWIAKANCKIMIPARYIERGLGSLEPEVYTVAIYAFIVEDKYYALSTTPNMIRLTPTDTTSITHDDIDYLVFHFPKGSVISPGLDLIMLDTMAFFVYNELQAQGNTPWFMDYDDLPKPYETARFSLGVKIGANHAMMEVVAASTVRSAQDKSVYFREILDNNLPIPLARAVLDKAAVVPLRSVTHGPTNTIAKLAGSYTREGIQAALANPSDRVEPIEDLLRR